jgi:phosphoribosylaminoimidazole (AIR) synthetase
MYQVFYMGIGMTIVCSPQQAAKIVNILPQAKVIGKIIKGKDGERVIIN